MDFPSNFYDLNIILTYKEKVALNKIKYENHRHYHSYDFHIKPMLQEIDTQKERFTDFEFEVLKKSTIYHDVIYDPLLKNNEIKSERYFRQDYPEDNEINRKVSEIILATIKHESEDKLVREFLKFDLMNFETNLSKLIECQKMIRKEFQFVEHSVFQKGSIEVLERIKKSDLLSDKAKQNIDSEIEFVKSWLPNIGVFIGSFNPLYSHISSTSVREIISVYGIDSEETNKFLC